MKKIISIVLLMLPIAAFAQDTANVKTLCQKLADYQPDGSADYQSGKTARGHDVASADLDGTPQIALGDSIHIAITADQAQQFNLPNAAIYPQLYVGDTEIRKDGSVYFNGQRLSQPQVQMLCDPKNR